MEGLELRIQSIIDKLDTLKVETEDGKRYVTLEQIHAVGKVNPPFDKFLFAVAQAEGMTSDGSAAKGGEEDEDENGVSEEDQLINVDAVLKDANN